MYIYTSARSEEKSTSERLDAMIHWDCHHKHIIGDVYHLKIQGAHYYSDKYGAVSL